MGLQISVRSGIGFLQIGRLICLFSCDRFRRFGNRCCFVRNHDFVGDRRGLRLRQTCLSVGTQASKLTI